MITTGTVTRRITQSVSMLVIVLALAAVINPATGCTLKEPVHAQDTILVQKQIVSKRQKTQLHPSVSPDALFFSVRGREGKTYQLFLFDVNGALVKQVQIRNRETTVVDNMEKGNYLFEVFSNDERIENGQVIVK
jgi:hypothetical protein